MKSFLGNLGIFFLVTLVVKQVRCKLKGKILTLFLPWPLNRLGRGCGSVGRAVASKNRGPRFESSHQQSFTMNILLLNVKTQKWREKESRKVPFLTKLIRYLLTAVNPIFIWTGVHCFKTVLMPIAIDAALFYRCNLIHVPFLR